MKWNELLLWHSRDCEAKKRCHSFTRVAQFEVKNGMIYITSILYFCSYFPTKANGELLPKHRKHHPLWMKLFWKWCQTKTRKKYHQSIQREKIERKRFQSCQRDFLRTSHTYTNHWWSNQKFLFAILVAKIAWII